MLLAKFQSLLAFIPYALASSAVDSSPRACKPGTPSHILPAKNIFQPNETGVWLENIAVRSNGDLLLTMLEPTASLYTLKRPYSEAPEFSLIHTFHNAPGLVGITETEADVFAVVSIQYGNSSDPVSAASAIWGVSFMGSAFEIQKMADLPDAMLPNGITSFPGSSTVFVADSRGGDIIRCDLRIGACGDALKDAQTTPVSNTSESVGVNGVHYREGYLSWSNSDLVSIFRSRLDQNGWPAANSTVETVGKVDAVFIDDFAEDDAGIFWIAAGRNNTIIALRSDGSSEVVAGSPTELTVAGCTAVAFGRTIHDSRILYVVTNGQVEPAKVVALDAADYAY
ncbi:hypothetical protein F4861DRAFT_269667 [Xylaria intraflava]|nr:hypothetical protein F4861DRAFT_269667 [Xylaria intraflava]